MRTNEHLYFLSIFHQWEVSNFEYVRDTLINFAYEEKEKHPVSLNKSNGGGWHSPDNIYFTYDNPLSIQHKCEYASESN